MWKYFYLLSVNPPKNGQRQARYTQSRNNKSTTRSLKDLKLISLIRKKQTRIFLFRWSVHTDK